MSLDRILVFLLTENCLFREALVRILRKKEDLVVVGASPYSPSAVARASEANPQVVLFDSASIALAGPRLVSRMLQAGRDRKIVMVGMEEDEATFLQAVSEGVVGYVLKDASAIELVRVIRAVAAGEAVCPPRFSLALFQCAARDVLFFPQTSETKVIWFESQGGAISRIDPPATLEQRDREPFKSIRANREKSYTPYPRESGCHGSFGHRRALPVGASRTDEPDGVGDVSWEVSLPSVMLSRKLPAGIDF